LGPVFGLDAVDRAVLEQEVAAFLVKGIQAVVGVQPIMTAKVVSGTPSKSTSMVKLYEPLEWGL